MLLITGTRDKVVPPGAWDDPSFTTTSNENDRFYYTGATAIVQSWSDALGCDVSTRSEPFDVGYPEVDCRTYCDTGSGWPSVLDCRADMGHEYRYYWSWKLVLDFFDSQSVTEPTEQYER